MPLNKPILKQTIKQLMESMLNQTDQQAALELFSEGLANAIDLFVKSGSVIVSAGIPVATTGTAVAQTGSTTSTGTGTIN